MGFDEYLARWLATLALARMQALTQRALIDVWRAVLVNILTKFVPEHAGLRSMYQGACPKRKFLLLQAYN